MNKTETISLLLSEALAPYLVTLAPQDSSSDACLQVCDASGLLVLERQVKASQLQDQRLLVDLVDGVQRDLLIAEGRLQPCVIAAQRHAGQGSGLAVGL
ncbi:DUF3509 domain-containing protein [Pseudomonas fontis]|uniref:DUF3509 domain-containing protein n=1 Tax=Pseudomonas fontis TaxID=2942633 RepID=A0ABT5P1N4_9PSED|nr:DUF3509 domain-containing protein [Pseudomonas fontis]MDD0976979.1 DUF3509 domain-containing protein [Pseudomonas fontis]MDD0994203.1 DUF3509 domain-containing protein [Pseudomonas fontis]